MYFKVRFEFNHLIECCFEDEENEFSIVGVNKSGVQETSVVVNRIVGGAGSEHSNDTENNIGDQQKDLSAVYDDYREIFTAEYKISEKDQILILKSFENKSENDIKLFIQ